VTIRQARERLTVEVTDDGRGGAGQGSGLTALRDRVAALGGRLAVESPAGAGTARRSPENNRPLTIKAHHPR